MRIIILILFSVFVSCNMNGDFKNMELDDLRKKNDSLVRVLEDINKKYVFDSISFREIPNRDNDLRLNGKYGLELLVVGYSPSRNYFIKYDTIVQGMMVNPDTLKQRNGGFKFNMELKEKRNPIKIMMNIENDYGKSEKGKLFDVIRAQ